MDFKEVGCDPRNWMDFAVDRDQLWDYFKGGNELPGSLKAN